MSEYANEQDVFAGAPAGASPSPEVGATFKAAKASAKAAALSAKEAAGIVLDEARERARNVADETANQVQHRYGDLEAWVQLRPARALGVAAIVGVLLGVLMRGPTTRVVYLKDR